MTEKQRSNSFYRLGIGNVAGRKREAQFLTEIKQQSAYAYDRKIAKVLKNASRWVKVCATIMNDGICCEPLIQQQTFELLGRYGWIQVNNNNEWVKADGETPIELKRKDCNDLQDFLRKLSYDCIQLQNVTCILWLGFLKERFRGNRNDREEKIKFACRYFDKESASQLNTKGSHMHLESNVEFIMNDIRKNNK
jgi:hypothetical protein